MVMAILQVKHMVRQEILILKALPIKSLFVYTEMLMLLMDKRLTVHMMVSTVFNRLLKMMEVVRVH